MANPILDELHEIRRKILREHPDDLMEYMRKEFEKSVAAGHPVAQIKQRSLLQKPVIPVVHTPAKSSSPTPVDR